MNKIDKILEEAIGMVAIELADEMMWEKSIPEAKQAILADLLALPELQDKGGIRKGSECHINGIVCDDCGYPYISEIGGCICVTDDELRERICQALKAYFEGEE